MRKPIKPFWLEGEFIDDSHAIYAKSNAERTIAYQIKDRGYLRVLDLDPFWIIRYDEALNKWFFEMTIYAIHVGKKKACQYEGISQGKLIPRNTHLLTSKQ
jgi:hypothetical protein